MGMSKMFFISAALAATAIASPSLAKTSSLGPINSEFNSEIYPTSAVITDSGTLVEFVIACEVDKQGDYKECGSHLKRIVNPNPNVSVAREIRMFGVPDARLNLPASQGGLVVREDYPPAQVTINGTTAKFAVACEVDRNNGELYDCKGRVFNVRNPNGLTAQDFKVFGVVSSRLAFTPSNGGLYILSPANR